MNFDIDDSIQNRDIAFEQSEAMFLYKDYLSGYKREIHKMKNHPEFKRDDTYHSIKSKHHIMYKYMVNAEGDTEIYSADGNRAYEFLIELDRDEASYGIYYGCRGLVKGGDQKEQNRIFSKEWDEIKYEITEVLNNTFHDKDFSKRFRMTDNANNKTFWPFWIMLYDDEDVVDVAALAVKLIFNVYKRYLDGIRCTVEAPKPKDVKTKTNYTKQDFNEALKSFKNKDLFMQFIDNAIACGYIAKDTRYDVCYKFVDIDDGTAAFILRELSFAIGEIKRQSQDGGPREITQDSKIPWTKYEKIFMTSNSRTIKNLRQSKNQANADVEDNAIAIFKEIMNYTTNS